MNDTEELGRLDSEKAFTKKGKENLKAEKKRVIKEVKLSKGGRAKYKHGGGVAIKGISPILR